MINTESVVVIVSMLKALGATDWDHALRIAKRLDELANIPDADRDYVVLELVWNQWEDVKAELLAGLV